MRNHQGLKSRNLISFPLDIPDVNVISVEMNERGDYIVTVESTLKSAICQACGGRITKPNGSGREIELWHLPILVPYQLNSCTKNKESGLWSGRLGKGRNHDHLT